MLPCCLRCRLYTHELDVFDGGTDLAGEFGLDVVVLVGFVYLNVKDGGFAHLVADWSFLHLNIMVGSLYTPSLTLSNFLNPSTIN